MSITHAVYVLQALATRTAAVNQTVDTRERSKVNNSGLIVRAETLVTITKRIVKFSNYK